MTPNTRRMFYNDDGGTRLACYHGAVHPRWITDAVDAVLGTPVTSLVFCVSYSYWGLYPSAINPMPGWRDVPSFHTSEHFRRVAEFYQHVRTMGWDIPRLVLDRAKEKGLEFVPSLRMNDSHYVQKVHPREHPLTGRFWMEHEDLVLGPGQTGPWGDAQHSLDFQHEAVRSHLLATADQIIDRYAVDGFEMDWTRHMPYFRRGEAQPELLTDMVRQVRRRLSEREIVAGKKLPLLVRVGPSLEYNRTYGLDVGAWIREGLVDYVIPSSPGRYICFDLPIHEWLALAAGTPVEIHPSPDSAAPVGNGQATLEMYRAAAANYYAMGAPGFYVFNLFCRGYPYADDAYLILRDTCDPDALAGRDKLFRADMQPCTLGVSDRSAQISLVVGDDLITSAQRGMLKQAMLRIRIDRFVSSEELEICLNNQVLGEDRRRVVRPDLAAWETSTASWVAERLNLKGPWVWIEIDLSPDELPNRGPNTLTVRCMKSSSTNTPVVHDVELSVKYDICGSSAARL